MASSQSQLGIPQGSAPAIDSGGLFQSTWYQFFIGLWKRVGAGRLELGESVYLGTSGSRLAVYRADDGSLIGYVVVVSS